MRKIVFCEFNMDTACVELRLEDGTLLSIDCTAVENEVANSMYQWSELDYLIYNDPVAYANLILNGDPDLYLKARPVDKLLTWRKNGIIKAGEGNATEDAHGNDRRPGTEGTFSPKAGKRVGSVFCV